MFDALRRILGLEDTQAKRPDARPIQTQGVKTDTAQPRPWVSPYMPLEVTSPNTLPQQYINKYADNNGNRWFENETTGTRLPASAPTPLADQPYANAPRSVYPLQPEYRKSINRMIGRSA